MRTLVLGLVLLAPLCAPPPPGPTVYDVLRASEAPPPPAMLPMATQTSSVVKIGFVLAVRSSSGDWSIDPPAVDDVVDTVNTDVDSIGRPSGERVRAMWRVLEAREFSDTGVYVTWQVAVRYEGEADDVDDYAGSGGSGRVNVKGYTRKDGTRVRGHTRSR